MKASLVIFCSLCILNYILSQPGPEKYTSEYKACTKMHIPTLGHCRISPVAEGWKCCAMKYTHNGGLSEQCGYVPEDKKKREEYAAGFEIQNNVQNVEINCLGNFLKISTTLIIMVLLF